jgi:hypothetical protein
MALYTALNLVYEQLPPVPPKNFLRIMLPCSQFDIRGAICPVVPRQIYLQSCKQKTRSPSYLIGKNGRGEWI